MARYVSIFLDYFALLENRLAEWERSREEQPWVSKLFLQLAEKERKRLASDLHDEVLQELLHVRRQADGLSAALPAPLAAGLDRLLLGLDNAEFLLRETCRELMPSFLAERGVGRAVDRLVEKTRLQADFELRYRAQPLTEELGEEEMVTVYRVIQELLSNAGKHSEAGTVDLFLGQRTEPSSSGTPTTARGSS
ncbi:histidine kinase [Paenibacillus sp. CC-CFT747]|nr:histidine kinase [Paenibacillus sp. CC-CFT747]